MVLKVKNVFGVWDIVVFVAMLVISCGIGIFFAVRGGKQKTQAEYLMADRNTSILPVGMSILISIISAISMLGNAAEMYMHGTEFLIAQIGAAIGIILAALLFVPLFYPLKIVSHFEYLGKRFKCQGPQLLASWITIFLMILYLALATYAPATALEAVTNFPEWAIILIIGAVTTFYTTIGGMKAVIWTDLFQGTVMYAGLVAVVIQGTNKVGSFSQVWEINEKWDRIHFFNFDPDPTVRHTFWTLIFGSILTNMGLYGVNQASIQRYNSLPTLSKAKVSVLIIIPAMLFLVTLTCLTGIVVFAYYADRDCDPIGQKIISNPNQIMPYFVLDVLGYPGVTGLFIASIVAGAISSLSSGLNALGAITWEDILKDRYEKKLTEGQITMLLKIMVATYGALSTGLSYLAKLLEGTIIQATISITSAVTGPVIGMFVLAAFFPWANGYGAMAGCIAGLIFNLWLIIGAYVTGLPLPKLPFPNGTCFEDENVTITNSMMKLINATTATVLNHDNYTTAPVLQHHRTGLEVFYSVSYLWYGTIGIIIVCVVGLIVSFITGPNSIHDVPTQYQIPLISRLLCCLPDSVLYKLNCGREFIKIKDIEPDDNDQVTKKLKYPELKGENNPVFKGDNVLLTESSLSYRSSENSENRREEKTLDQLASNDEKGSTLIVERF